MIYHIDDICKDFPVDENANIFQNIGESQKNTHEKWKK